MSVGDMHSYSLNFGVMHQLFCQVTES